MGLFNMLFNDNTVRKYQADTDGFVQQKTSTVTPHSTSTSSAFLSQSETKTPDGYKKLSDQELASDPKSQLEKNLEKAKSAHIQMITTHSLIQQVSDSLNAEIARSAKNKNCTSFTTFVSEATRSLSIKNFLTILSLDFSNDAFLGMLVLLDRYLGKEGRSLTHSNVHAFVLTALVLAHKSLDSEHTDERGINRQAADRVQVSVKGLNDFERALLEDLDYRCWIDENEINEKHKNIKISPSCFKVKLFDPKEKIHTIPVETHPFALSF